MIDKLEFFIVLARERHFGRAAEECGVTQPTLSASLKQLEDQLGVTLVQRGSRFQGLTPEGQRVLEWARRIVGDARTMREEMKAARKGLSGHARIAVIPTATHMVTELTVAFTQKHPAVTLSVTSCTSYQVLSRAGELRDRRRHQLSGKRADRPRGNRAALCRALSIDHVARPAVC
jgi:DNA-binding transcriptional LysR family regulator